MAKSLLLGNGINARIGITGLAVSEIKDRFRYNMYRNSFVSETLYGINLSKDVCNDIIQSSKVDGIESLAGSLYTYIKTHANQRWTDNDEIRLQDIVKCIALTSIFYDDMGKICTSYDSKKLLNISEYEKVFALNYIEFWDKAEKCIYLHGKFDLDSLGDGQNILLGSSERNCYSKYRDAMDIIGKFNNVKLIDTSNIIFSPDSIPKEKLIDVIGVYPSSNLYFADDLFPHSKRELYVQLWEAEELDIFGLSPYGDDSLIDVINRMKSVTIYVYNMETSTEVEMWDKKLYCPHVFKESSEINNLAVI
ncbi:MAG: hypothetical protein HFI70_13105 [Lachnospiraceae bacterium]|nr:hypothetical protein [Lachnospiraceae bacterium]